MKFPVFFPVSREFFAEKGSHLTASSATSPEPKSSSALLLKYKNRLAVPEAFHVKNRDLQPILDENVTYS
jgi:hypothetical protein